MNASSQYNKLIIPYESKEVIQCLTHLMKAPLRKHIDPVFKQVLVEMSARLAVPLETQVEVSRLPRTIDAVMKLPTAEEIARVESETPFIRLRANSQVEFKAIDDPLTAAGYHLIRGRTHLYLGEHDLSASQMSVTIVSARKPITVLSHRADDVLFKKIEKGYYINSTKPPVVIIVINELPIMAKNYPFLLFAASEKKFREFLRHLFKEKDLGYVHYAYRVRPEATKEELKMLTKDPYLSDKDFRFIVQDIGPQLINYFPVEERLAGLAPQERLAGLAPQERLAGLAPQERLAGLAPQERLAGLAPQERLAGLAPQERLAGLAAEEIEAYLKRLKS